MKSKKEPFEGKRAEDLIAKDFCIEDEIVVVSKKRLGISSPGHAFDSFSTVAGWGFPLYYTQLMKQQYFINRTKNGYVVLDLGCGKAELFERLWKNGSRCTYVGIDYSRASLDKRKHLIKKASNIVSGILIQDDFSKEICLKSESVDIVIFSEVIEHFEKEDGVKVIREIKRVLKPGGELVITTSIGKNKPLAGHKHEYTYNEFVELVEVAGFDIEKTYGLFSDKEDTFTPAEREVFDSLKEFYGAKMARTILALRHPELSRSWLLLAKKR